MSAPFDASAHTGQEVDVHWDAETGFVIVEADPEIAELEARLRTGTRYAEVLFPFLLIAAGILGAACVISQTMKWVGM